MIGMALLRAGAHRVLVDEALRSLGHLPRGKPIACGLEDVQSEREPD